MNTGRDKVLFRQLPIIAKIIRDETWLEGERRGCEVGEDDPTVRENVCRVILRVGAELRRQCTQIEEEASDAAA
jgi:hypothetical protein